MEYYGAQELNLVTLSVTMDSIMSTVKAAPNPPLVRVKVAQLAFEESEKAVRWVKDAKAVETFSSYPDYEVLLLPFTRMRRWEWSLAKELQDVISGDPIFRRI